MECIHYLTYQKVSFKMANWKWYLLLHALTGKKREKRIGKGDRWRIIATEGRPAMHESLVQPLKQIKEASKNELLFTALKKVTVLISPQYERFSSSVKWTLQLQLLNSQKEGNMQWNLTSTIFSKIILKDNVQIHKPVKFIKIFVKNNNFKKFIYNDYTFFLLL